MRFIVLLLVVQQILATPDSGLQLNGDTFATGINSFSLQFTKKLEYTKDNIIFSPLGLAMSVGMLLNGAQGNTSDSMFNMLNVLQYSNKNEIHKYFKALFDEYKEMETRPTKRRKATVELSNLAMSAEGYNLPQTFTDALKMFYEANVGSEKFATNAEKIKEKLNKFVKEKTHDMIPEIFKQPLDTNTVMVIISTIYFKGLWVNKFETETTKDSTFFNADRSESTVKMMTRYSTAFKYTSNAKLNATFIELPYEGEFSMFIILPEEKYGLSQLLENLNSDELESIIKNMTYAEMNVYLPMFTYDYQIDLLTEFPKMGVNIANALTPLNAALRISSAFHTAKIQVHESGTEAAVITVIIADRIGSAENPGNFRCDHPFAFFIRDMKSNVNLFAGVVNKLN